MPDPRIAALQAALAATPGLAAPPQAPPPARAAVALLVRPAPDDLELLLIRRAEREGDPWSGHMALPGGRADPRDADAAATAVRETREEVGIDLDAHGRLLGVLDEVAPRSGAPRIAVTPFVFAVEPGVEPVPNHEVQAAVWIPVGELSDPGTTVEYLHELAGGATLRFPAYGTRGYVIWGLTHRILTRFLELHAQAAGG
ncbi:MAG TPA: CoA pyrophosphatase [Longimicrobiaceae bacterium]|nr:CoA pyrophosphatase [Longimicrobiaceae bacterium]